MVRVVAGVLCAIFGASAVHAEGCTLLSHNSAGEAQTTSVNIDWIQPSKLEVQALPQDTSAIMCLRPTIVPSPNDVRVVIELGVAFGIAENGPRSLWIYATSGRLQTRIDGGALTAGEQTELDAWLSLAQKKFSAALDAR